MRWKRVESTDVIDQRAGGGVPGGRVAIPGGMGITGIIVFLAIQLLSGGGGTSFGSTTRSARAARPTSAVAPFQRPGHRRAFTWS